MDPKDRDMIIVGCLIGGVLLGGVLFLALGRKKVNRYLNQTTRPTFDPNHRSEVDLPPSYTDVAGSPPDYQSRRQSVTTIS